MAFLSSVLSLITNTYDILHYRLVFPVAGGISLSYAITLKTGIISWRKLLEILL
jgi:hypothetical protein